MPVAGVRCTCGAEISHEVGPFEDAIVEEEDRLAAEHRQECDGTIARFEEA